MDERRHFLLEKLRLCCQQRKDKDWAFLAAASGDELCIQEIYRALASYTWQYFPAELEPFVNAEWRVVALSISRLDLLQQLLLQWEMEPNTNNFENWNTCSEWIYTSAVTARCFLESPKLEPSAEPWSWEEYAERCIIPNDLISRPLKETFLTVGDIQKSIEVKGAALKALRTQSVKIDPAVFEHYSQLIETTAPYATALLIELSRSTNFPIENWIENVIKVFPKIQNPIYLMFITGGLLNPQWRVR